VSPAERFVRHQKLRTDRAISQAYGRLATHPRARATFEEMLGCVRHRSPGLLLAPTVLDRHLGVEALVNLSRFTRAHVRTMTSWSGCGASWRAAVNALVHHLLSQYRVPAFLAAAWYATDQHADAKRRWFIAHARGASFRSLWLPIRLTRKMEHIFLGSADHLEIDYALRRAELLGLGANATLAAAVLATRPARDLGHGEFWRSMWLFLIANRHALEREQVGPLIDFVNAVRHERVAVETASGTILREPPQPEFSLKGRTPESLLRLMDDWHRTLGVVTGGLSWEPSRWRPLAVEVSQEDPAAEPAFWELTELTSSAQLRAEGAALQHCVASYGHLCWRGTSRIWSLRRRRGLGARSVVTIEVDTLRRTIVQARGFRNRRASGKALGIVQTWAAREGLRLSL